MGAEPAVVDCGAAAVVGTVTTTIDSSDHAPPGKKRHREMDGPALLSKLQRLDPDIRAEDYRGGGCHENDVDDLNSWDVEALVEDIELTESYGHESLEATLEPLRKEIKSLVAVTPRKRGAVQVSPTGLDPLVFISDAEGAQDLERLRTLDVRRIVNCSPQTVKTGHSFYGAEIEYLELWQDDLPDYCVMQDFDAVWDFSTVGGNVLLHCEQGVNRSGALGVALCMRLRERERTRRGQFAAPSPEQALRVAWRGVAERKGKVLNNASFQRQVLLFARVGLRWYPTLTSMWRTPKERDMARFRMFAQRVAWALVCEPNSNVPLENRWRMAVFIRDGTMRGEMKMKDQFELDAAGTPAKAERRIRHYAARLLSRKSQEQASGAAAKEVVPAPA
eukprot:TRINITY_DN11362_c0_g1_i1.p1 TRINITY_DN11362_c0_g1~~TRINITY_DN11362_c0_g1_i1.p1  ORF type:complete len:391 (+),score=66.74 TRINITY_DN11362_c0_g1_i1:99-1271(+)